MPWLGMPVKQSKVLYLDFELKKYFGTDRIKRVAKAMFKGEIKPNYHLDYWPLRGHRAELLDLLTKIRAEKREYDLIILDPYYKLATGIDENDAKAVGEIVNLIEDFSEETGAAIVFAHHFSKGNKSETDHIDRAIRLRGICPRSRCYPHPHLTRGRGTPSPRNHLPKLSILPAQSPRIFRRYLPPFPP